MPQIVGVVLSWPRASLAQVLGCWSRQTYPCELFIFTDQSEPTLGRRRNAAVRGAIAWAQLGADDWLVTVDDDDHYAPWHVETIAAAIQRNPHAGVIAPPAYGSARRDGSLAVCPLTRGAPPWVTIHDPGPGPNGGVAVRVGAWAQTGGYRDTMPEDVPFLREVRRQCGVTYSDHASYIHRRDLGDHRNHGVLESRTRVATVPDADRWYSPRQRAWDAFLRRL